MKKLWLNFDLKRNVLVLKSLRWHLSPGGGKPSKFRRGDREIYWNPGVLCPRLPPPGFYAHVNIWFDLNTVLIWKSSKRFRFDWISINLKPFSAHLYERRMHSTLTVQETRQDTERRLEEVQATFAKGARMMNMLFEVAQQTSRHRLNYSRLYLIRSKFSATCIWFQ